MAKTQFLDESGAGLLKSLLESELRAEITAGDAPSYKSASIRGNVISFYTVASPDSGTTPATTITLPETDLSNYLQKIASATAGHVVTVNADGTIADSGTALTDLATDVELSAVEGKVDVLIGSDNNKSARTIAGEELARLLIPEEAKESLDTLEEIANWIQEHPDDAAQMASDISDLQDLVGTIPPGATATDVVNYIVELVNAEQTRATGVEGGLDTRVTALEAKVGDGFEPIPEANIRALFAPSGN